ncbi:MAG: UDP-2,3-diacylglucosamine diphosphatase LpxI [Spirochaetes bacterium]|nr:UDP-2,3-diacylglucosamine diphosphatase LpxI [Spirochaetota bacterium]
MKKIKKSIGILAGGGAVSFEAIKKARAFYEKIVVIAFKGSIDINGLKAFKGIRLYESYPGLVRRNVKILQKEGVKEILFIGKINKTETFKKKKFDLVAVKLLLSLKDKSDSSVLQKLVNYFEKKGISVLSQKKLFKSDLVKEGLMIGKGISKEQKRDLDTGFPIAKTIASLGIGQSLIVQNGMVIAVEAIEGTDEMINRSRPYLTRNAIFIKVSKPDHNPQFDIPGFGPQTLKNLIRANIKSIVLESDWVLLIDKKTIEKIASKHNVSIIGVK